MNFLSRRDLKEKESCKNQHKKQHTIFNRAFDVAICVQNRQKLNTETRIRNGQNTETFVAGATRPRLRIIATVIRHLPFPIESVRPPQSSIIASRVPRKSFTAIVTNASFHCRSFTSILSGPKSGAENLPDSVTCARKTAAS